MFVSILLVPYGPKPTCLTLEFINPRRACAVRVTVVVSVFVQARPSHGPHRPHDMLTTCACIVV